MLQLTKRTEYGLIALIHLADREGQVISAREIGDHYQLPKRLLAEAIKDLQHAGLVDSHRGATGGYNLARPAREVTLGQVITALEGAPSLTSCDVPGGEPASAHAACDVRSVCPIRSPLQRVRAGIWALLDSTTLRSLADSPLTASELVATTSANAAPDDGASTH